jgi:hypothetical protein
MFRFLNVPFAVKMWLKKMKTPDVVGNMKKLILGALLYISALIVSAFGTVGIIYLLPLHNFLFLFFGFCLPLGYIVGWALIGFLELK